MSDEVLLQAKFESVGFAPSDLSALIREHGQEVANLIADAIDVGFSKELILEVLQLGGGIVLEILTKFKAARFAFMASQAVVEGEKVDALPGFDGNILGGLLNSLLQKFLPQLLPLIQDQLGSWLSALLQQLLTKK
jgi:hypothetical protein